MAYCGSVSHQRYRPLTIGQLLAEVQYGLVVGWDCGTANVADNTFPGRADGYPTGPPTDPDVRD